MAFKVVAGLLIFLAVATVALAIAISYEADCELAPILAGNKETMKAIVHRCYGSPDVLALEDIARPSPSANEVLIKVRAASVNPYDWRDMRGSPYVMRLGSGLGAPKNTRLGVNFAGTVEEVGEDVQRYKPGEEVFGGRSGAFAEYHYSEQGHARGKIVIDLD